MPTTRIYVDKARVQSNQRTGATDPAIVLVDEAGCTRFARRVSVREAIVTQDLPDRPATVALAWVETEHAVEIEIP